MPEKQRAIKVYVVSGILPTNKLVFENDILMITI